MSEDGLVDEADNRVPSVLRTKRQLVAETPMDFLGFADWLQRREHEASDWIVVARAEEQQEARWYTWSVLARLGGGRLQGLLATAAREVLPNFGNPFFNTYHTDKLAVYVANDRSVLRRTTFRPFTIRREFSGVCADTFELIQEFLLFHKAYWDPATNDYRRLSTDGSEHVVARRRISEDGERLEVDAHDLRDYLAATGCHLVRYHDHNRFDTSFDATPWLPNGRHVRSFVSDGSVHYEISVSADRLAALYKSRSGLLGKDIVPPYDRVDNRHTGFDDEQFVDFIVGRNADGSEHLATCEKKKLSSYFRDSGRPHALTPVYFKEDVLLQYYHSPARYSVSRGHLAHLNIWSIELDYTEEGLVQAWLGDLGDLPFAHQQHWKQHNVHPRGTITEARFNRDFRTDPTGHRNDPVYYFREAYECVQSTSDAHLGDKLFLPLSEHDQYALDTLRVPITDEAKELDEQLLSLAKLTADSINMGLLRRKRVDTQLKSLEALELFLSWFSNEGEAKAAVAPLRVVQSLRSASAAHRKGRTFAKALRKAGLEAMSNRQRGQHIIEQSTKALTVIAGLLRAAGAADGP